MALVIAGEIDKMGILYEKYKKPLYAYFFRLTGGDNQSSEDLVHTVFYRMIRYKTSFTGQGSFVKWLFRIAHNTGIDYFKKNRYANNYRIEAGSVQNIMYENNELEREERRSVLKKAMSRLKPHEREVIILGKIDCLKYREIAEILNTTESNVKIRIFRTLRKLKDIYLKIENKSYDKERTQGKVNRPA